MLAIKYFHERWNKIYGGKDLEDWKGQSAPKEPWEVIEQND